MAQAAEARTTVDVTFCANVRGSGCVPEHELTRDVGAYRSHFSTDDDFDGAVLMRAGNGPVVKYEDELGPAVQYLCFGTIPDLMAGKTVTLKIFSYPGTVRLSPEGDRVVISGDVVQTAVFPLRPLAQGLYDCGIRFIEFARRVRGKEFEHILQPLEELSRDAAQVLSREDQ